MFAAERAFVARIRLRGVQGAMGGPMLAELGDADARLTARAGERERHVGRRRG
jgi:hypothetical protein